MEKVKNINNNGDLIYEGEYLKGVKNGQAKKYDSHYKGNLIFEGYYLNGKKMKKVKNIIVIQEI